MKRIDRLDESMLQNSIKIKLKKKEFFYLLVNQQRTTIDNNLYDIDPSDPYVNFQKKRSDSSLETSCVFKNGRRDSSSISVSQNNHSGVVH